MDKDLSAFKREQIDEAKVKGTIKVAEILEALSDTDITVEKLVKACEALERNGIEIAPEHANAVFDISEDDIDEDKRLACIALANFIQRSHIDDNGVQSIAGMMGGKLRGCTYETKNVLLESLFQYISKRTKSKISKRYKYTHAHRSITYNS